MSITVHGARELLLAADRTSEEKFLGAYAPDPAIVEWAELQGYEIVGYVFENGISGATPIIGRDQLIRALWQVRDDPRYAGVIVPSTERLARDKGAFDAILHFMSSIGKHCYVGIRDRDGRLLEIRDDASPETIIERHERDLRQLEAIKSRRALSYEGIRARRAKIERLGYGGGRLRPAYFMDRVELGNGKAEFMPNRQRLQWAIWMVERHAEGWTGPRIATELNQLGVLTKAGYPWTRDKIRKVRLQLERVPPEMLHIWLGVPQQALGHVREQAGVAA